MKERRIWRYTIVRAGDIETLNEMIEGGNWQPIGGPCLHEGDKWFYQSMVALQDVTE